MPEVITITFKDAGPQYYFDPGEVECKIGDWVIVETARGTAMGKVITLPVEVPERELELPLKSVQRKAKEEEVLQYGEFQSQEREVLAKCAELVAKHEIGMKLVAAEYNFDGKHLTVYFTAEGKVDFRALLKEMGACFKTRVELRQIGARDAAKLLGGIGKCGRILCCKTFLDKFVPISVRMARDQSLPLNPTTISGECGKLLCCLKYEHDQYVELKTKHPAIGNHVTTPQGEGTVRNVNHLKEIVTVELEGKVLVDVDVSDLTPMEKRRGGGNARK